MHSSVCVRVCGGGKALSASPSLQHSLSFTPGRLLRNVSGREAKNILSSFCSRLGLMGLWGPSRPLGPWGRRKCGMRGWGREGKEALFNTVLALPPFFPGSKARPPGSPLSGSPPGPPPAPPVPRVPGFWGRTLPAFVSSGTSEGRAAPPHPDRGSSRGLMTQPSLKLRIRATAGSP